MCKTKRLTLFWVRTAQVVSGVLYKANDGSEKVAKAHLTIICDGMYSNFRKRLCEPAVSD